MRMLDSTANYVEVQKEFDRRLLSQFSPAAVFVTEDLEIVLRQIHDDVACFLVGDDDVDGDEVDAAADDRRPLAGRRLNGRLLSRWLLSRRLLRRRLLRRRLLRRRSCGLLRRQSAAQQKDKKGDE